MTLAARQTSRRWACAVALLSVLFFAAPSRAFAFPQVSSRLAGGISARFGDPQLDGGPFRLTVSVVTDVLFGPRLPDAIRAGFSFDLRTQSFRTIEPALLGTLSLPTLSGFPLTLGAGASWAARLYEPDGVEAVGRVAWGFRPFSYYGYGYGIGLFADVRRGVTGMESWTMSGGIEVDLEWLVYTPVMFFVNLIKGS